VYADAFLASSGSTVRRTKNRTFSLIIEGTTEKLMQNIIPLNSIYNKNLGFVKQKMQF
jgi:hypothetical protein